MRHLKTILFALALVWAGVSAGQAGEPSKMTIFKTPWCGCCESWANIMKEQGYTVEITEMEDLSPIKKQAGVPPHMEGCHTAVLDGYVLEGHVPVAAIDKLMRERPYILGIAVPGMPEGSPGMGDDPDARYSVYSLPHDAREEAPVFFEAGK